MELDKSRFSKRALSDFALIDKALLENNQQAYATLMDQYRKPVYHMILKMVRNVDDAEDLTIESFAKAFRNLHKFRKNFTFSTWLFRIATNNTIDFLRKRRIEMLSLQGSNKEGEPIQLEVEGDELDPHELAIKEQKADLIRMFVTKLPPRYQRLVKLRYFKERSYQEIAEELDAPLGTIKAQLYRARELLYDLVKEKKNHF